MPKNFKVGTKNMTVRELIDHPDNVHGLKDSQFRARLAAGDHTLKSLLRPVRKSVEGIMLAMLEAAPCQEVVQEAITLETSDGSTAGYYQLPEAARELQDLISHKNMNAQIGEIFRTSYRYGEVGHSEKLRDAKKMRFYAQAEIDRLEKYGAA